MPVPKITKLERTEARLIKNSPILVYRIIHDKGHLSLIGCGHHGCSHVSKQSIQYSSIVHVSCFFFAFCCFCVLWMSGGETQRLLNTFSNLFYTTYINTCHVLYCYCLLIQHCTLHTCHVAIVNCTRVGSATALFQGFGNSYTGELHQPNRQPPWDLI